MLQDAARLEGWIEHDRACINLEDAKYSQEALPMEAGVLVTIITTVLINGGIAAIGYGKGLGSSREKFRMINDKLEKHDQYHKEHYQHAQDDDIHWTPRERNDLRDRIMEIKSGQDDIIKVLLNHQDRMDKRQ
jgi:hypothetical protein